MTPGTLGTLHVVVGCLMVLLVLYVGVIAMMIYSGNELRNVSSALWLLLAVVLTIDFVTGLILNIAMIRVGIKLQKEEVGIRKWAARLAWAKLVRLVTLYSLLLIVLLPALAWQVRPTTYEEASGSAQGRVAVIGNVLGGLALLFLCFGPLFPLWVLRQLDWGRPPSVTDGGEEVA